MVFDQISFLFLCLTPLSNRACVTGQERVVSISSTFTMLVKITNHARDWLTTVNNCQILNTTKLFTLIASALFPYFYQYSNSAEK